MCRWLAYSGPAVPMSTLLTRPDHSLVDQSVRAAEGPSTTNGDGLGVGWYGQGGRPGRYRGTHPAWNDTNFIDLAEHVSSPLFLAHVRSSSGTPVQLTNCHPFRCGRWLFQHNGSVPAFARVERELLLDVDPDLFPHIEGSTDSELLFFLALTYGLGSEPRRALQGTAARVERALRGVGAEEGITFSAAITDGTQLHAVRYATSPPAPSLYYSAHLDALRVVDGSYERLPPGATVLVSEPLDELSAHWVEVPEGSFVTVEGGEVTITAFAPPP